MARRVLLLLLLPFALIVPIAAPAAAAPAPPAGPTTSVTYQISPSHDGYSGDTSLSAPLVKRWSRDLGGAVSYPLIAGNRVFVTVAVTADGGYGTTLFALNRATGATLWSQPIPGTYFISGAAFDNGRVYVVNFDGVLRSFDAASGAAGWSVQLPGQYSFTSPPTADGGTVYVTGAGSGGTLYAVRESTGALRWSQQLGGSGDHSSPALSDTGVFVSFSCGAVQGFDRASGDPLWSDHGDCSGGGGKTAVYHDNRLYARDPTTSNEVVRTATGAVVGTFAADPAPAFAGTTGLFLSAGTLSAVRGSRTLWTFAGDGGLVTAPIAVGDTVYVGSSSGLLYGLSLTSGRVVWSTNVGAPVSAPDEQNAFVLAGLGAGRGLLAVPAGNLLVAYGS
jgi:outer membrane protein assembly factor BamB